MTDREGLRVEEKLSINRVERLFLSRRKEDEG